MFSAKHIRARKKENKSQNHIIVLFVGFLCLLLLVQFVQFIFEFEIQTEENTNKGERSDGDSSISQLQMCVSHVFEIPSLYAISFCMYGYTCNGGASMWWIQRSANKTKGTEHFKRVCWCDTRLLCWILRNFDTFSFHLSKFHVTNYPINKMAWVLLVEKAHTHT